MKKYRVAQFLPYFPPHKGGLENVAAEWSKAFVQEPAGSVLNVTFSVGQPAGVTSYQHEDATILIIPAFEVITNFPFPKFWKKQFWQVLQEVRAWNPDIIQTHTRFFLSTALGGICAKKWKMPWVHIEHGSGYVIAGSTLVSTVAKWYDRTLGKWVFRKANSIIAISQACSDFIQKEFTPTTPISVIYRWIDFYPMPRVPNTTGIPRITFIGRLTYLKGVDVLLEALAQLKDKKWMCSIVGAGEEEDSLKHLSKNLGLEERVHFVGMKSREDIAGVILPSTDIFVNPSRQEGLPTTVIEALLAGCMVIATDVGGTREIGVWGDIKLIPADHVEILTKLARETLQNFTQNMNIKKRIKEQFDSKKCIWKYQKIYSELSK